MKRSARQSLLPSSIHANVSGPRQDLLPLRSYRTAPCTSISKDSSRWHDGTIMSTAAFPNPHSAPDSFGKTDGVKFFCCSCRPSSDRAVEAKRRLMKEPILVILVDSRRTATTGFIKPRHTLLRATRSKVRMPPSPGGCQGSECCILSHSLRCSAGMPRKTTLHCSES